MIANLKAGLVNMRRARHDARLDRQKDQVDALLVSYPKSGRTWLRYLLSIYLARVYDIGIDPDLRTTFTLIPIYDLDAERGLPCAISHEYPQVPLIAASHREFDPRLFSGMPTVFLIRDPRDVLVSSYFHQTRHKNRFNGDLGDFIDDPTYGAAAIARYHNRWIESLKGKPHIVISYEELSERTADTVRRVIDFLDLPVDDTALATAIEQSRFDRMRKKEERTGIPGHSYDTSDADSSRVRRGKVAGYTDYLGPTELARIEAAFAKEIGPATRSEFARSMFMPQALAEAL